MRITKRLLITLYCLLFTGLLFSQDNVTPKIQLKTASIEKTANYAVWRTDYYICTGIAYAKSQGKSVDDFARFVGNAHTLERSRGKGLEPFVQLLSFVITNYKDGYFEIISESDSIVTMKFNRAYERYFKNGPVLGVTIDEFEKYLYSHIVIMCDNIDLDFVYRIEGDFVISSMSLRK